MKDGISQYGRIIIVVLVLLTLIGFIFGGMYLYRIGGFSDTIPDGVEDGHINRAPPTLNAQDQTTLVDRELNLRSIITAFNADGDNISNKIVIKAENADVFNPDTGIFKSSEAGKFTFILSVTDEGEIDGKSYKTTTTKRMTIMVDNTLGQYVVTIVTVDNGVLLTNTRIAKKDAIIKLKPKPDTGYEFDGVNVVCVNNKALTVTVEDDYVVMPEDDIIITPKWKPVKVNVLLSGNGGKIEGETVFEKIFNEAYGELPGNDVVKKPGYVFNGWSLTRNGDKMITSSSIVSTPNAHYLYAQWKQKTFTVTFDPANGSDKFTKTVKYGEKIGAVNVPTKEGYTFRGWVLKDDPEASVNINTKYSFDSDIELIAIWQPRSGFVKLDANSGSVSVTQIKVYYGQTYSALPQAYKLGYKFVGWFTERTGGTQVLPTATVNTIETMTLYAHWEEETYTLTFNANTGTFADGNDKKTSTSKYKGTIKLPTETPTCENREFLGWYTSAVGGVQIFDGDVYNYSSNKTFYAHWSTTKIRVSFDANGGILTSISNIDIGFGQPYGQLPTPKKTGYRFIGWYTSAEGGTLITNSTIMNLETDHTLYAHWELAEYTISFNSNNSDITRFPTNVKIVVVYGTEIPELESDDYNKYPERNGYVFSHWELKDGTQVSAGQTYLFESDIVLYPVWKIASVIYVDSLSAAQQLADNSSSDTVTFERTYPVNESGHYVVYDTSDTLGLNNVYRGKTTILSVLPSNNVTAINDNAFTGCTNLTYVNFGNSVITKIGNNAFQNCTKLSGELTLPETLTILGANAFDYCSSLTSLDITKATKLTTIPAYCFRNCTSLSGVLEIPNNITTIGNYAFRNCNSDNGIILILPTNTESLKIGNYAFANTKIKTPLNFKTITSLQSLTIGEYAFSESTISSLFFPENIGDFSIGQYAFYKSGISNGSGDIAPLIIPKYITDLPYSCFEGCTLLSVVVLPDETMSYGGNLFNGCSGLTKVTLPCNVPMSSGMFYGTNIKELIVTPGLTDSNISTSNTFYSVSDVLNYRLDNSSNSSLKIKGYMELTKNYTSVPWSSTLTTATIKDGVLNLSNYMFYNCTQLRTLSIPVDCNVLSAVYYHKDYTQEKGYMESIFNWKDVLYDGCERYSDYYGDGCIHCKNRGLTDTNTVKYSLSAVLSNCTNYTYNKNVFTNVFSTKDTSTQNRQLNRLILTKGLASNGTVGSSSSIKTFKGNFIYTQVANDSNLNGLIPWMQNENFEMLTVEPGVVIIPNRMFSDAKGLINIVMPCNLKPRGDSFANCYGVDNVTITTGLDLYGNYVTDCYDYDRAANLSNEETSYDDSPWYNARYAEKSTLGETYKRKSVNFKICEGVTSLGNRMFDTAKTTGYYSIGDIEIASTVISMDTSTFLDTYFGVYDENGFVRGSDIIIPSELDFTILDPKTLEVSSSPYVKNSQGEHLGKIRSVHVIKSANGNKTLNYSTSNYNKLPWNCFDSVYTVTFADDLEYIPAYYFYKSKLSGNITIPSSVTYIGSSAFEQTAIKSITLSEGMTSISKFAFNNISSLTSVTIPKSVTNIGNNAFSNCTNLQDMYYLGTVNDWAKIDFVSDESNPMLYAKNEYFNNQKLTDVTFSEDITEIKNYAFCGCDSITSVVIGENISSVGEKAFADCVNLNNIEISNNVQSIHATSFANTAYYNNETNWENDVLYIGNFLLRAKETLSGTYEIKDGTKKVFAGAFENCTALTDVKIPNTVIEIGDGAFYNCSALTEILIPDSVTFIGTHALYGCSLLETVSTGDGLTSFSISDILGITSFNQSLKKITFGKNIQEIDVLGLSYCLMLNEIVVSNDNEHFTSDGGILYNKSKTTLLKIPSALNIETYTMPDSVEDIGLYAITYHTFIKHLVLSSNITAINDGEIAVLPSLESVTFNGKIDLISDNVFTGCDNLTTIKGKNDNTYLKTWAAEKGLTFVAI